MKPFLPSIAVILIGIALGSYSEPERKWLVTAESRLEISGSSNVNKFQCTNLSYAGKDTLYEKKGAAPGIRLLNGVISLKAEKFDCRNKLITNDFRRTLNAEEYPEIKVRFLCLRTNKNAPAWSPVNGEVEITIAGISRKYDIACQFLQAGKSKARLKGEKTVRLSDFDLEPRPKVLGMVKVDDTVKVNFHLVIQYL